MQQILKSVRAYLVDTKGLVRNLYRNIYGEVAMPISIRLPGDIEARLHALAIRTGRSKTFYVTEAINDHIEDLYLTEKRLGEVRSGKSDTVPIGELMKRYGLAD
jgi:RHH-type rel operon transcriptional repressor/antitoxin RelB